VKRSTRVSRPSNLLTSAAPLQDDGSIQRASEGRGDELSAARKQAAELSERVRVLEIKLREAQQALEATY